MFENKTEYVILNNMLDKVTAPVSKEEGSLIYDALSPVANELAKHYMELDAFIRRAFIQTSNSGFLDLRAAEYGLKRKEATKATAALTFTGTNGTVIPQGFLVQTVDGKQFRTVDPVTIASGTATVSAQAVDVDTPYNVAANTIVQIPIGLAGLSSVTNPSAASGGTSKETDEDFKTRILNTVRNPGSSGNVNHYVQWAMEIDGVGAVKVLPLWNGNGTVKVAVLDSNRLPASSEIVDAVRTHIEANRPIGAAVTVQAGTLYDIDVSCDITLDGTKTMAEVTAAIRTTIEDYFKDIAYQQTVVSYPKVSALILAVDGVADHTGLTLNNTSDNIILPSISVARLDVLTIT
jgi:uncharacterized phage protein gp47/JayE